MFFEIVTKHDNPRFPDRPGRLKPEEESLLESPYSWIGFRRAWLHDIDEAPKPDLSWLNRLYQGDAATAQTLRAAARAAVEGFRDGRASDDDVAWVQWLLDQRIVENCKDGSPRLAALIAEFREADRRVPAPRVISGIGEGDRGFDVPILPYGNWKSPGKSTPRGFLAVAGGGPAKSAMSGRLELAETVASPSNPLTARVMVNRVWAHLFGRGLVATTDNFGRLAAPPSHPELLDYLAASFVEQGWSVKRLIREIVLSETFRQSGVETALARQRDPGNLLLHRYAPRRLEAEAIRDSVLVTAGNFDATTGGPSVHPFRLKPKDYRKLYSGPLEGGGRRSLYLKVTRMEGATLLDTFDFPAPLVSRGTRDLTNVPAQALALLNDPFIEEESRRWAEALLTAGHGTVEARIDAMFGQALQRAASGAERERFRGLAFQLADLEGIPSAGILSSPAVWQGIAHTLFNLKEFIYIQ